MRKEIHRLNIEHLSIVLARRGYRKDPNRLSWRRGLLHVMVNQKKSRSVLRMHKDPPGHDGILPSPVLGHTRYSGKDLAYELRSIMRALQLF